jgi:hypothetical protein
MIYYFATVWQPDLIRIMLQQTVSSETNVLITRPLPNHLSVSISPTLACLDCPKRKKNREEIVCQYKYDYLSENFYCKYSKDHQLIEIQAEGNVVEYKGVSYLPCLNCKKVLRTTSGVIIPKLNGLNAKDFNKLLTNMRFVHTYTHLCIYCMYHASIKKRCVMCNAECLVGKNKKASWQVIKVFGKEGKDGIIVSEIYLCPMEKNVKQAAGGVDKIWSFPLLVDYLKS